LRDGIEAAEELGAAASIGETDVVRFLKTHPDFLNRHPELLGALHPPRRAHGDGVIDLQHAMLERLRGEVTQLKDVQHALISTTRGNMTSTTQVHACVLAMLEAPSFEHLIHIVTQDVPQMLDADVVALCVEAVEGDVGPAPPRGVRILDPGEVDHLIGKGRDVHLIDHALGDPSVFDGGASLVRSAGYARLKISPRTPPGMLALGSRQADTFHPSQATELLGFMAAVLALQIRTWLDLPA
jgi:uncharacterized protein YigA (DUF484 family)